jgi:uncharacterized protein (TIGR04255 family)
MGEAANTAALLPSFERPPVIEVAVGVHFLQLPGLNTVALIRLADMWRARFLKIQEQPPLPPVAPGGNQPFTFEVVNSLPPHRFWLLTEDDSLLVQIQHDRLLLNWRKVKDDDPYPRYDQLREVFSELWSQFSGVVLDGQFGVFQPTLAEVTFFNRIPVSSAAEVPRFIAALNRHWGLDGLGATSLQAERALLDGDTLSGRQNIALGYRPELGSIQLEISSLVRVDAQSTESEGILAALDKAHDIDVLTFDQITTDEAHAIWGKHNVSTD